MKLSRVGTTINGGKTLENTMKLSCPTPPQLGLSLFSDAIFFRSFLFYFIFKKGRILHPLKSRYHHQKDFCQRNSVRYTLQRQPIEAINSYEIAWKHFKLLLKINALTSECKKYRFINMQSELALIPCHIHQLPAHTLDQYLLIVPCRSP